MKPSIKFLGNKLIRKIIDEAIHNLCTLGVEVHNESAVTILTDHGAKYDSQKSRIIFTRDCIENALSTVPNSFKLYDVHGNETHNFFDYNVYFTPGSAALYLLDYHTQQIRTPKTADYINYAKVVNQLEHIASQSTAMITDDVHEKISDSYRLFLSLLYCKKPVVTGTFTTESFEVMKNFQIAIRGSKQELAEKPLTIFSCCPTSPLKWSNVTSQNVIDCATYSIPVEFISMPLAGFIAPVTLVGTLIQHTAETLSGIAISQFTRPGTPVLYGGSPAIFDIRYETTPMGAIETMMIDCAYNEIGKYLNLPTQAYISLSDSKLLDAQAGLESGMGATLAVLSGINNISGPGMLDFESCQSLEKLVLDNQICGMTFRLKEGIEPKDDFPSESLFKELLDEGHLLIADHSRKYLKEEHLMPNSVINRANRNRWKQEGSLTLGERAHEQVEQLIKNYEPIELPDDVKNELITLMENEAKKHGQVKLPDRPTE